MVCTGEGVLVVIADRLPCVTIEGEGVIVGEDATENNGMDVTVGIVWGAVMAPPPELAGQKCKQNFNF